MAWSIGSIYVSVIEHPENKSITDTQIKIYHDYINNIESESRKSTLGLPGGGFSHRKAIRGCYHLNNDLLTSSNVYVCIGKCVPLCSTVKIRTM